MKLFLILVLLILSLQAEPITAIPQTLKVDEKKVLLGKELFFDPILSANNTISCATCHHLNDGGDDNLQFSFGIHAQEGTINSPTVYNAVFNFRQFWNGSAKDLKEQAKGPIENPLEMGNSFPNLIKRLNTTAYKDKFSAIYKDGITKETISDAIAEFEKTLITPNSPFDKYLNGDKTVLTEDQIDGYRLFKSKGCIACHHGVNVGGNHFNKFGAIQRTKSDRLGRFEVTHKEQDKYYFKVPSLRNIEKTAPYLHDGRYQTLEETVKFMAYYQLGKVISQDEVDKIVVFLHSLTGEIPKGLE